MTANLLLLLTAAIWGFGFVAQVLGMDYLGPFAFIGARFLLGALSLVPVIWYLQRRQRQSQQGLPRLPVLRFLCLRHDFVRRLVLPAGGLAVYHRLECRLYHRDVHDLCANLRFDAGYGDGLDYLGWLFGRGSGFVSSWGR